MSQIKSNLPVYDSLTTILIEKYSNRSMGSTTIIYPSEGDSYGDYLRFHDSAINKFCSQNDISYIQIYSSPQDTFANVVNVTYYLHDNNYQYIFDSKGETNMKPFENTKVLTVPINANWTFQYEKPNF